MWFDDINFFEKKKNIKKIWIGAFFMNISKILIILTKENIIFIEYYYQFEKKMYKIWITMKLFLTTE